MHGGSGTNLSFERREGRELNWPQYAFSPFPGSTFIGIISFIFFFGCICTLCSVINWKLHIVPSYFAHINHDAEIPSSSCCCGTRVCADPR